MKDDKGQPQTLLVREIFYIPDMSARLLSPQHFASFHLNYFKGNGISFTLRWNSISLIIPFNSKNILAILHTEPGHHKAA